MAKLNEGDVIEGIFTIALSLYIAYGKVEKSKLNLIRTQVQTKMFESGRFKHTVVKNQKRQKAKKIPDFFNVDFEMRLKPQSVTGAFGEEYQILYKRTKDVGKIDTKIDQLIKSINTSSFVQKTDRLIEKFLDNNKEEVVTFTVVADGIAGESSGGNIKGDVNLQVYSILKGKKQIINQGNIPFSLKSESVTVANLSPYKGMLDFAKAIGIKWDAEEKYSRLSKPFNGPVEQAQKFKLIQLMYGDLKKQLIIQSKNKNFTARAMNFLRDSIFGKDLADVIDVQSNAVKEITVEHFNNLEKNISLSVQIKGNNLVFLDQKSKIPIFQIRTKLRPPPANEAKFYLEVGKGVYDK